MDRQAAIDHIEGMIGFYSGVRWNDWTDEAIRRLYIYVCTEAYRENLTIDDTKRVGITL